MPSTYVLARHRVRTSARAPVGAEINDMSAVGEEKMDHCGVVRVVTNRVREWSVTHTALVRWRVDDGWDNRGYVECCEPQQGGRRRDVALAARIEEGRGARVVTDCNESTEGVATL